MLSFYKRNIIFVLSFILCLLISTNAFALSTANNPANFGYPVKSTKIVKGFSASKTQYGPGHRGTDFEAKIGEKVSAVAPGQVIFAGLVAGKLYVSINHGNDIVSTYHLATKTVKVADIVTKGQLIGTVGEPLPNDEVNTFHFSMRIKDVYVDPMLYITGTIPVREISLTPVKADDKPFWKKMLEEGAKLIKAGYDFAGETIDNFGKVTQSFYDWLQDKGETTWDFLIKTGKSAWDNWNEIYNNVKDLAIKVKDYLANGAKDLYNATIKTINELGDKLYIAGKAAMDALFKIDDFLISTAKKAYGVGKGVGDWFVNKVQEKIKSVQEYISSFVRNLVEPVMGTVNTLKKLADEYFDINDKWKSDPVACMLHFNCGSPIEVACDTKADPSKVATKADGYKGSGNAVFFVSGLNTKAEFKPGSTKPLAVDYKKLGYSDDDVQFYSYTGTNKAFNEQDTYQDINISVKKMDEQVKQFAKDHPGEKMDLIAHSLGGSVASVWLAKYYDENDKSYPKLGKIIFYASPLGGTALATGGQQINNTLNGASAQDILSKTILNGLLPPSDSPILEQLSEGGYAADVISDSGVANRYKIYDLQYGNDLIVTAGTAPVDGVEPVALEEDGSYLNSHSDAVTSDNSISQTQRILTGKKVACPSFRGAIKYGTGSILVHGFETNLAIAGI
jgi:murein DD-endopeptidase MepM/ murein hydrolase activator NlpD/pimeloyl-ACP methyl ester carboxylesterase